MPARYMYGAGPTKKPSVWKEERMNDVQGSAQCYLEPRNDDLPMRPSGHWAREKLDYLERYVSVFVNSMHNKPWRGIHYIDLFAGPGKCRAENDEVYLGSPLIALKTTHPFTRYFFADMNEENVSALQQRCSVSPRQERVHCFTGDSNLMVDVVAERIVTIDRKYVPGQWPSLNLAFLDPAGLDLHWSTVETLARLNRMDLIVHYPLMGLARYMPRASDATETTKVDLFFGSREWRPIYQKWQGQRKLHRQLIHYYKERLCSLGYSEVLLGDETGYEPLMRNVRKRAPLYQLLFASKHPLGHDFWRKVTQRNVYGQERLL